MSLRDALLKSGKVSKRQAQSAATADRKKRRQDGGHRMEEEARSQALERDEQRRQERDQANRERAQQLEAERQAHEQRMRIKNLIMAWLRRPGLRAGQRWHFVRSSGHVGFVMVDREGAAELEYGAAGIIEWPDDRAAVRVLRAEGIQKIAELQPDLIRFYVGPDGPEDPLVRPARRK